MEDGSYHDTANKVGHPVDGDEGEGSYHDGHGSLKHPQMAVVLQVGVGVVVAPQEG